MGNLNVKKTEIIDLTIEPEPKPITDSLNKDINEYVDCTEVNQQAAQDSDDNITDLTTISTALDIPDKFYNITPSMKRSTETYKVSHQNNIPMLTQLLNLRLESANSARMVSVKKKVCGEIGCGKADITVVMDATIRDGADIISTSLGGNSIVFYHDIVAIGAFSAIKKGIVISCVGGNSGLQSQFVTNSTPWILTIDAGTMNRNLRVTVKLGKEQKFYCETIYQPANFKSPMLTKKLAVG